MEQVEQKLEQDEKPQKKKPKKKKQQAKDHQKKNQEKIRNRKRPRAVDPYPIHPDHFYRWIDGPRFFGYRLTVMSEKIASGELPAPVSLSDDGRAKGWFGRQILAWQAERLEKAQREQEQKQTAKAVA